MCVRYVLFFDLITDIYGNRFIFDSHKSLLVSFYLVFQTSLNS